MSWSVGGRETMTCKLADAAELAGPLSPAFADHWAEMGRIFKGKERGRSSFSALRKELGPNAADQRPDRFSYAKPGALLRQDPIFAAELAYEPISDSARDASRW